MNTTEVPSLLRFVVAAFVGLCLVACASSGSRSDDMTADSGDDPGIGICFLTPPSVSRVLNPNPP